MVEQLDRARYIVIAGALISCFTNLIDDLSGGSGIVAIAFYSGSLLVIAIILILSENKIVFGSVFGIAGVLMFIGGARPNEISPSLLLFGYSTYLINNKYYNYFIYLSLGLALVAVHGFNDGDPQDLITTLIGYAVFFALNELIYTKRQIDVKAGG